jgi:hypothetical protein
MINPNEVQQLKQRAPLPIILGIIMFLLPTFLVSPKQESLESVEKSLDTSIQSARQTVISRKRELDWFEKFGAMQQRLSQVETWLQPEPYLPQVIDQLHTVAETFGVKLHEVSYSTPARDKLDVARLIMQLNLSATYDGIRGFLRALEGFPLPLFPGEITATRDGQFSIELMYLFRPEK